MPSVKEWVKNTNTQNIIKTLREAGANDDKGSMRYYRRLISAGIEYGKFDDFSEQQLLEVLGVMEYLYDFCINIIKDFDTSPNADQIDTLHFLRHTAWHHFWMGIQMYYLIIGQV